MNFWFSESSGSPKIPASALAEDSSLRPPPSPPEPPAPNYLTSFPPLSPISSTSPLSHLSSSLPSASTLLPPCPSSLATSYFTTSVTTTNLSSGNLDLTSRSRSGSGTICSTVHVTVPPSTQLSLPLLNHNKAISSLPPESTQGLLQIPVPKIFIQLFPPTPLHKL